MIRRQKICGLVQEYYQYSFFLIAYICSNLGWLDKNAVDKIENKQTHKVEGYFMSSDTSVSQGNVYLKNCEFSCA